MVSEYLVYSIKNNQLQFITTKTPEEILIPLSTPNKNSVNKTGVIHYGNKEIPYTYFTEIGMYKVYNKEWNTNKLLNDRRVDLTWVIKNNILSTTHKDLIWSQQFQFKNKQWHLNDVSKTNIHANIQSILQDSLNNYIVSSNPNQIRKIRIDNNFYTTYLVDSVNPISTRSIISDAKKNIFVASYSGLFKIDSLDITHNISNESNYAFLQKNDSLTCSNDVYLLTKHNFSKNDIQYFNQKNWPTIDSGIQSLAYKNENQIWIGSLNGLHLFDEKTESFANYSKLNKAHNLSDTYINDILQLPNNKVWLATNNGAYLYNSKTKTVIHYSSNSKTHKIPHTKVLDIHKDKHNIVWLAGDKGLVAIDSNGVTNQYLKKDGLANNIVCSMLETKNHLWVGTYDGISRVNLTGNKKQFSNYLKGHEFNHSSSYKLNDSTLFFGSMNGVYKILTNKVPKRSTSQKLVPVSLTTFQKEKDTIIEEFNIKNLTRIKLDHDANYFEFKFALNKSFNHTKNNFLYKIEGLTKTWIPLNNTTTIRQYGIPSGNYVLKVKGINEEGMQAINEISLPIHVSQIFYKTI
ncbi:ligand-binding sensor domain-containing protein [Tenacibaculum retecalamus]|uniref:ligand-binding sensor domain-containing protein n=1 Tax=Tenacibaculum retecalamus TaxID=3018315 RepID=UPI0023D96222|nr:triple tyrosine motif-containing protein [Tenacibaculum retecalamus]WBX71360.1 triple tyrosine motif-containing protein [Tenacibaculum retecalamus]